MHYDFVGGARVKVGLGGGGGAGDEQWCCKEGEGEAADRVGKGWQLARKACRGLPLV